MKKIFKTLTIFLLIFFFTIPMFIAVPTVNAVTETKIKLKALENAKQGYDGIAPDLGYETYTTKEQTVKKLRDTRDKIIGIILGFVGTFFLVLIVWGGYDWMFAGGNEEKITKAKQRIKMASIGLVIVLTAYILAKYIIDILFKNTIQS
jgi:Type IV secretion system pilin